MVSGLFLARFFKWMGHKWFVAHIIVNTLGLATTVAAFGISIYMVSTPFSFTDQTTQSHAFIGLIVTFLSVLQPLIGWWADMKFDIDRTKIPLWPDQIHWIIGRICFLLAFINIILGIFVSATPLLYLGLFIGWIGLLIIAFSLLEFRAKKKHHHHSHVRKMVEDTPGGKRPLSSSKEPLAPGKVAAGRSDEDEMDDVKK